MFKSTISLPVLSAVALLWLGTVGSGAPHALEARQMCSYVCLPPNIQCDGDVTYGGPPYGYEGCHMCCM
ncbi:hypothetical protein PHISP_08322 [Aspergillus sp. HF37]|nr:hypothetical protein PHISP_08322 [Aspergillus sp. HF37]